MVLDEEMGYGVPREQLKAEVLNFVDGYFEDTEYAAEQEGYWNENYQTTTKTNHQRRES